MTLSEPENNLIQEILERRLKDVQEIAARRPVLELQRNARRRTHRSLSSKLEFAESPCIIAEMKKASPSAGIFKSEYYPEKIAAEYFESGVDALSVLTEPHYFQGDIEHIGAVRKTVDLPILRKDFIGDPYQVYETAAMGADVILLIVKALQPKRLERLYYLALSLGLEVLMESHTQEELYIATGYQDAILGINNRDLETLKTDLNQGLRLSEYIPSGRLSVIESGIKTRKEIEKFWDAGYRGFLIGEVLMKSHCLKEKLAELSGTIP